MLYNRPISSGVYYFVNNWKDRKGSQIDVDACGFLKRKAKSEIEENEKSILMGELYGPIGYDWMFRILNAKYQEPEGETIARLTKQLGEMDKVITRELGVWVRNPEGGLDSIGKKRRERERIGISA